MNHSTYETPDGLRISAARRSAAELSKSLERLACCLECRACVWVHHGVAWDLDARAKSLIWTAEPGLTFAPGPPGFHRCREARGAR